VTEPYESRHDGNHDGQEGDGDCHRFHGFALYHGLAEFVTAIAAALIAANAIGIAFNYVFELRDPLLSNCASN
jgi:hypothetical protein